MPHCCAYECNNESKKQKEKGKVEKKVTFHRIPGNDKKNYVRNGQLPLSVRLRIILPKCPYLCSDHFDISCFDESVDLQNQFLGGSKRKLKKDAIPTIFSHRPAPKARVTSVARAAKWKHQEVRITYHFVKKKYVFEVKESFLNEKGSYDVICNDLL